jgi:NCAIR mutase (PurE)-related protein
LDENKEYGVVAIPYGIGCGLAGGVWSDYEKMLNNCSTQVVIYRV